MRISTVLTQAVILQVFGVALAQDQGWPREIVRPEGKLVYYQPHFDEWHDFKTVKARLAFQLTPKDGKTAVGLATVEIETEVDVGTRLALLKNLKIVETRFPSEDEPTAAKLATLLRSFVSPEVTLAISLDRAIAATEKKKKPTPLTGIKNDPPPIFASYVPSILLIVDTKPALATIANTKLGFVVNSNWPLFFDKSKYYLLVDSQWLEADTIGNNWKKTTDIPKDFSHLPDEPNWADVKKSLPAKKSSTPAPMVFYSAVPSELLLFNGPPIYENIPGTGLKYATNTESDVFTQASSGAVFVLIAGRWFRASSLQGPWTFVSEELPGDFAAIPPGSPAARVRSSVPGTPEAEDSVLLAQVPTTAVINRSEVESKVAVNYVGEPEFKQIDGTSLSYATNTQEKIVKFGDAYYLCYQAVWFVSSSPKGPWRVAESVPKEIYEIPPSSPVYNITYVTQSASSSGSVESSYTAGYMGMFVTGMAVGSCIYWGTGWYYPPYMYYGYGYPIYYGYPYTYGAAVGYNPYTGRYGAAGAVYGPYGGAGWGATYNPRTGTYARGATVYGYGGNSRSVGQAYNPYTGTYAATRQGSSPYSQWGSSVVTRGDQWARTGHISTGSGTIGGIRTSGGGAAIGGSGAAGSGGIVKTGAGDVYAGRDGNVYKRNDGGGWQKYENGGWNNVEGPSRTTQSQQTPRAQTGQVQGLNQDWQNRERGSSQTQRVQQMDRSGYSRGGGGYSRGSYSGRGGGRMGGRRR